MKGERHLTVTLQIASRASPGKTSFTTCRTSSLFEEFWLPETYGEQKFAVGMPRWPKTDADQNLGRPDLGMQDEFPIRIERGFRGRKKLCYEPLHRFLLLE